MTDHHSPPDTHPGTSTTRPPARSAWGPSDQQAHAEEDRRPLWFRLVMSSLLLAWFSEARTWLGAIVVLGGGYALAVAIQTRSERRPPTLPIPNPTDPLASVHVEAARHGGGVYLGRDERGTWRSARPERAVLVLGPPRSGKSSGVIIPALLAHLGPAVSTSTKSDVLAATSAARSRVGTVWQFDPTGSDPVPAGRVLRWSPVTGAGSWDGALLMARAMVDGARVGTGTTDATHWSRRAAALLAPLLHAAAISGRGVASVLDWVLCHDLDDPGGVLQRAGSGVACSVLIGLQSTEARERSSIFSAAADALQAYTSRGALAAASDPNFDAERFVRSAGTVYIHAPAEDQALAAPLVCGLLSEIRRATYQAHRDGQLAGRVLFALDEAANIAPLQELPQIASEGGGQGLQLLAALQDLSQARARWGVHADGFLTLFGAKLILPGIADSRTLEQISLALGEYDRETVSTTRTRQPGLLPGPQSTSRTVSTQRQRVIAPGDVANIPTGRALYLDGLNWQLLTLTPAHRAEPWRTLTQPPPAPVSPPRAITG